MMGKEGLKGDSARVCIIGFDSLDYYLIEKYDLENIRQEEFGKIDMADFMGYDKLLSTPTIWTSFITGLPPEEHKVVGWTWTNPILDRLKRWGVKTGLAKIIVRNRGLSRLSARVEKYTPNVKGRIPTIFDYARKPIDMDVPCYSPDAYEEERHDLTNGLGNPIEERQIADKAWKTFVEKRAKAFRILSQDWDLFMVHFYLPDIIQHLLWYREEEIKKVYREMDKTAHDIREDLGEKPFIFFISDHGQERGQHNPNAFYSCNHRVGLHNPKMTDFADIIRQKLGAPSRSEIDEVKKRLRELGYI